MSHANSSGRHSICQNAVAKGQLFTDQLFPRIAKISMGRYAQRKHVGTPRYLPWRLSEIVTFVAISYDGNYPLSSFFGALPKLVLGWLGPHKQVGTPW